jgi:ABC-type uncharacterized transport system substrate-binding protein
MRRRDFIAGIGGTALAWPSAVQAQQSGSVRRVGVLIPFDSGDPYAQSLVAAFKQRLYDLGWIENRNIRLEYRYQGSDIERIRAGVAELVALAPDIIVVWSNPAVEVLRQATQTIPIVFVLVSEPVGSGFITNLAHPGGNLTGFQNFEPAMGGKWLQLLKEIAPSVQRIAVVHNQNIAANVSFLRTAEALSASVGVTVTAAALHETAAIEPVLATFAREPGGGLIVTPNPFNTANDELIIALAARLGLPAIYPFRPFAVKGGLVSYGFDTVEQQRGAAKYVDLILRGAKPGDLPVQLPANYQLIINLKTAKALGLDVPVQLQQRADEVIE